MEASKIQVAETGNKRTAVTDDDVSQAINDLGTWLKTNVPEYAAANLKEGTDASGLTTHKHL
jgi:sensor c-di-GMP phosphodiesterase-like protein